MEELMFPSFQEISRPLPNQRAGGKGGIALLFQAARSRPALPQPALAVQATVQTTREIYLDACAQIGAALAMRGFKYAKSGPHAKRSHGDFSFGIYFQSSVHNSAGSKVALWIHANVRSKRLSLWRATKPHFLRSGDWVAGGQLGNLRTPTRWLDINLADADFRSAAISVAIEAIQELGLPLFAAFEDVPALCQRVLTDDVPGIEPPVAVELLLCFSTLAAASDFLGRFFAAHSELLPNYQAELQRFSSAELPRMPDRTEYATQLAFATIAYGVKPPEIG
jgi:hypothetical protein